jgi:hypothetical protein
MTPRIELDADTYRLVTFAARVANKTPAQVVAAAVEAFVREEGDPEDTGEHSGTPVYCRYQRIRVEGIYNADTNALEITSGPLAGTRQTSPSSAAVAVVVQINPARRGAHINGWRFWRITANDRYLDSLR